MSSHPQQIFDTALPQLLQTVRVRPEAAPATAPAATAVPTPWFALQRRVCAVLRVLDVGVTLLVAVVVAVVAGAGSLPWLALLAVGLPVLTWLLGGASQRAARRGAHGRSAVLRAGIVLAVTVLALAQVRGELPPVLVTAVALPGAVAGMYAARCGAAWWVRRSATTGRTRRRTLLLGDDEHVAAALDQRDHAGTVDVVGRCSLPGSAASDDGPLASVPVLGPVEAVARIVADHGIDQVEVAGSVGDQRIRQLSTALAGTRTALVVTPGVAEMAGDRVHLLPVAGSWRLQILVEPRRAVVPGKALLDRVLGTVLLLLAAPVIAVAAVAVRTTSPGPAFYGQERVGRDGRTFRMWKLRSMVVDADAIRAQLAQENDGDGVLFKMRRDPRVTRVGAVLRRYSLDELPQLWNVVKGDMSLVGPRPPLPTETAQYVGEEPRRLVVKPGLTGLWQVSGRSDLTWAESVRLDLRYVDNWSLAMDLRILAATARAVVGGSGAY